MGIPRILELRDRLAFYERETKMEIADLTDVLSYQNEAVVLRFMETWDLPRADADDIFEQMKKWLWLTAKSNTMADPLPMAISPSMKLVDEMWHTFILFTRDYQNFCEHILKYYAHHTPTSKATYDQQILEYETNPKAHMSRLAAQFERLYELVYDQLGEETLNKWYSEYTERYTDEFMRRVWRWSFSPYDTRIRQTIRLSIDAE